MSGMPTVSSRDPRIDALKGLAILAVVTYHAAGQYFRYSPATGVVYDPWAHVVREFLFSFMLPLFAFLSGWVLGRPGAFRPKEYFGKRTLGLLVPYLAWETIYGPWRDKHPEMLASFSAFVGYYAHILADPHYEGRMWYLYVLWIALMVLGAVRLRGDRTWVLVASVLAVYALASVGQFHWLRWVYAYAVAGVLWRRYESALLPRMSAIGVAGGVAFVPLWLLLVFGPLQLTSLKIAAGSGWRTIVAEQVHPLITMVIGAAAVVAILAASYGVPERLLAWPAALGVLSLGVYVTHFHFVEMWRGMQPWFLPVNVAIATVIAVALTLLLGVWRPTAMLLLGEPWVRQPRHLGEVETETL